MRRRDESKRGKDTDRVSERRLRERWGKRERERVKKKGE